MYKLVQGTKAHMPSLLRMGRDFYAASGYEDIGIPYSEKGHRAHALQVLRDGLVVLATVEETGEVVGMMGILLLPFHLNPDIRIAAETVWWIDPAHRRSSLGASMLAYAKDYAKSRGATINSMSVLGTSPEGLDAFLRGQGMVPLEHAYLGVL